MPPHRRFTRAENTEQIDEARQIFVPGVTLFDHDNLNQWLNNRNDKINISLLMHKFVPWYRDNNRIAKEKRFDILRGSGTRRVTHNYKTEHLKDIVRLSQISPANYQQIKNRHFFDQSCSFCLTTRTRLLIGFAGSGTVLENSLCLHPLYGFPVIPGSALKGLARHYCQEFNNLFKQAEIEEIFGNEPGEKDKDKLKEGKVVFLDAWPEEWAENGFLELDVISPHYSKYYNQKTLPADNLNPVPVVFLAVRKGVKFRFCLLPSRFYRKTDGDLIKKVRNCLKQALINYGAGAKTGSSYGYFEEIKEVKCPE